MNKFKVNETVLYEKGTGFELGVVKEVIPYEQRTRLKQDGLFGAPSGELHKAYKYRVWYHTGDTTALTDERYLYKIENAYAFTIIRKSANKEIELSPARQLASRILGQLELYGDFYYKVEDWLTDFLEGNEHDMPYGIESEYSRMALRVEIRKHFDDQNAIDISSDDIEKVVDLLLKGFSRLFYTDFIYDTVRDYIDKNNIKCESEEE